MTRTGEIIFRSRGACAEKLTLQTYDALDLSVVYPVTGVVRDGPR